jgi:monovalent cation:H+ antiporter, CPA1 family
MTLCLSSLFASPLLSAIGADNSEFAQLLRGLIILLIVAIAMTLVSRYLRLPYITGLVLAGLAIADFLPQQIGLDSSLIFNLFLPILLFEAAINTDISRLRSTVRPIALLAGPGVLIAAGVSAVMFHWGMGLIWIPAMLAGVILAVTDTVSVIAVFKEVTVPARLITIVEGESLFNDGMALVLFSLILTFYKSGQLTWAEGLKEFGWVMVGGTLVGLTLGYLGALLYEKVEDSLSPILLTVAIALGAFQLAQGLGASGVVAVVVAGLVMGNIERSASISASSRITVLSFWEYAGFGVNTFIFLLIGLELDLQLLWRSWPLVLGAVAIYQTGRLLAVYPLLALAKFSGDRPVPFRWQHVLFLGNIKGSLSMALALTLPAGIPQRDQLIAMVFGAVLLSLLGQGLSLPWVVQRLKLARTSEVQIWVEGLRSQLMTAKAAQDELTTLLNSGLLPKSIYEEMRASYQVKIAAAERSLRDFYNRRSGRSNPSKSAASSASAGLNLNPIRRRLLLAEKAALSDAMRQGMLLEEVVKGRSQLLDQQLLDLEED